MKDILLSQVSKVSVDCTLLLLRWQFGLMLLDIFGCNREVLQSGSLLSMYCSLLL